MCKLFLRLKTCLGIGIRCGIFGAYLCWKAKAENGKVKNSHTRYDEVDNMEESFSSDDYVKENI